jgi:membrane protein DedA with SNARE-associated domain
MGQFAEWFGQLIEALQSAGIGDPDVWPYVLLAFLVAVEGPISTLLGAAAAASGYLDARLVLIVTVSGNIVGDIGWFYVGYFGLHNRLLRYGRWLGLRPRHLARLERAMHDHASKLILLSKVAYGMIVPTLLAAGMARVPWRRWLPVVIVMETVWSFVLVWIGFHATWLISDFERGLRIVGLAVITALLVGLMTVMRNRVREAEMELDPLRQVLLREEDPLPAMNGNARGPLRPAPVMPPVSPIDEDGVDSESGEAKKEPERPTLG